MPVYAGGQRVVRRYIGASEVVAAYAGADRVYAVAASDAPPIGVDHWWDPSHAPSITSAGGLVQQIDDRVGGVALSQTVASRQPSLAPMGGRQGLDITSEQAFLEASLPISGAALSVLVVSRATSAPRSFNSALSFSGGLQNSIDISSNNAYGIGGTGGIFRIDLPGPSRLSQVAVLIMTVSQGQDANIYDDLGRSATINTDGWGNALMRVSAARWGARSLPGERGDVVIAHRLWGAAEIDAMGAWAAARWGTTWTA